MLHFYTSTGFFVRALPVVVLYRAAGRHLPSWARQLLLIGASVYFLSLLAPFARFAPALAIYVGTALALGVALARTEGHRRTALIGLACLGAVAVLAIAKYGSLAPPGSSIHRARLELNRLEWVGLSYLTFRAIDYWAQLQSSGAATLPALSYLLFFPSFVAGPVDRFAAYHDAQHRPALPLTFARTRRNCLRIALGVVKLLLPARWALVASVADPGWPVGGASPLQLALGLYSYYLYFYFDFSGYCDVAIGLADFFDVRLPENFRWPFLASSPQDFWNRWHVSLSHWVRDHVFFRLLATLARRCPWLPEVLALLTSSFVSLFLVGAWHGDGINWALYGCYHGAALCMHQLWCLAIDRWLPAAGAWLRSCLVYRVACVLVTFNYVAWGLLLTFPLGQLPSLLGR